MDEYEQVVQTPVEAVQSVQDAVCAEQGGAIPEGTDKDPHREEFTIDE